MRGLARRSCMAAALAAVGCEPLDEVALPDPFALSVRGAEFQWHVRYPGLDGQLGNADDFEGIGDLHVPSGVLVRISLDSDDFIYGFRIPAFAVNKMVVPDVDFEATFRAEAPGEFELLGDQMCGFRHDSLKRRVVVHESRAYGRWLAKHAGAAARRREGDRR